MAGMPGMKSAFELYKELKEKNQLIVFKSEVRDRTGQDHTAKQRKEPRGDSRIESAMVLKNSPLESKTNSESYSKRSNSAVSHAGYAGERLELIEKIYEKSRYQKLYGIAEENEEHLSKECLATIKQFSAAYPRVICKVHLCAILQDDRGNPLPSKYGEFFDLLQKVMRLRVTLKLTENTALKLGAIILLKGRDLHSILDIIPKVDLVQISLPNYGDPSEASLPGTIIIFSGRSSISQRIESEKYQIMLAQSRKINIDPDTDPKQREFVHAYMKESRPPPITRPSAEDMEFILSHIGELYPWVKGRYATLQKIVYNQKAKRDELRFYRNSYKGGKHKIRFDSPLVLEEQIAIGAFAFIADSACSNTLDLPCGPYSACIDFDPSDTKISYDELLDYVFDFHSYFVNEIGIDPRTITWLHSGNNSFHVRIAVPEFDVNQYGLLLPKTHSFDTYYRRKKDEMNIQFLHDAVELLILQYNLAYTRLGRVAQRIPAFVDRSQFRLFADNRTVLHGGARVPLSWHTKSHLFCRVFDVTDIPDNSIELKYLCSRDYLKRHPQWLRLPESDYSKNADAIFTATSEYLTKNFNTLTYKLQVWNGRMDSMTD